jgi:hypothetical protein
MNIYAISVNSIIVTAHTNFLKADPYKSLLEEEIWPLVQLVRHQKGVHKIKIAEGVFYAQISNDNVIIVITDDVIAANNLQQLFNNITAAKNSKATLKSIIRNPENATVTKIELVQEQIDEVTEIMQDNVKKMLLRGEKLEEVEQKTKELYQTAQDFKQSAKKLRQNACWDSFFIYRFYKWMWPAKVEDPKTKTEYEYTPANKLRS